MFLLKISAWVILCVSYVLLISYSSTSIATTLSLTTKQTPISKPTQKPATKPNTKATVKPKVTASTAKTPIKKPITKQTIKPKTKPTPKPVVITPPREPNPIEMSIIRKFQSEEKLTSEEFDQLKEISRLVIHGYLRWPTPFPQMETEPPTPKPTATPKPTPNPTPNIVDESFLYFGQTKDGLAHGKGSRDWKSGFVEFGTFQNGSLYEGIRRLGEKEYSVYTYERKDYGQYQSYKGNAKTLYEEILIPSRNQNGEYDFVDYDNRCARGNSFLSNEFFIKVPYLSSKWIPPSGVLVQPRLEKGDYSRGIAYRYPAIYLYETTFYPIYCGDFDVQFEPDQFEPKVTLIEGKPMRVMGTNVIEGAEYSKAPDQSVWINWEINGLSKKVENGKFAMDGLLIAFSEDHKEPAKNVRPDAQNWCPYHFAGSNDVETSTGDWLSYPCKTSDGYTQRELMLENRVHPAMNSIWFNASYVDGFFYAITDRNHERPFALNDILIKRITKPTPIPRPKPTPTQIPKLILDSPSATPAPVFSASPSPIPSPF